jgi:alkaline phosphatase D
LGLTTVAAVVLLTPAAAFGAPQFTSGVTAGEVTDDVAIVWGRVNDQRPVRAQVATDTGFHNIVKQRTIQATIENNNTFQTRFDGLDPNRIYHYRFCVLAGRPCSQVGHFRTAPPRSSDKTIRFAYSGDETGFKRPGDTSPFWGNFRAFRSMVAEHNDFNIDFGDTIYSDPEVPNAPVALSLEDKWSMYRMKLAVDNMQRIRKATGIYNHWDDHEFINDFSIPENGRPLYDRGVRAFRDYMPVKYSNDRGIYRTFRWGKNLELFFLDARSFRSAKASSNHTCDNPETNAPDFAPTAPQSTRNFFSSVAPSLAQPVSQACKNRINNPNRTYLGSAQLNRFINAVDDSTATWKVVMNELPIQQYYVLPYDRWEGYAFERLKLLNTLQNRNVDHLAFLTTDVHAGLANVVRKRTLMGDAAPSNAPGTAPVNTRYRDFVIGPVGTTPFWEEIDEAVGVDNSGQLVSNLFFKPEATGQSPGGGMGMACAQGGMNSYAEVKVTSTTLRIDYKDENGDVLVDSDGSTPCGPYILTN